MSTPAYAKCPCSGCGVPLEYPVEAEGRQIDCPECGTKTVLSQPVLDVSSESGAESTSKSAPEASAGLSLEALLAEFAGRVPRSRVSILYQLGLLVVTVAMVTLPLIYIALVVGAGWAVYYWATHFTFLLGGEGGGRAVLFKFLFYITPIFMGVVLVFFLIKPLFARRPRHAQPLALNPGAEPVLFAFVTRICETVGAPFPRRIDVDCNLNASASFRRGLLSFLGNDLVLTIGVPLVAGMNLRQFAGVLAHEFGHFTQGFGMRLTYVIRSVNGWFARVVYERDAWDVLLVEWAQVEDARVAIVVGMARLGVWFSRVILHGLMMVGHGIGCFMLRQMEYDADRYEIHLAGSKTFEETMRRFHVLGHLLKPAYRDLRGAWNINRHLPEDFPAYLLRHDAMLRAGQREKLEDSMGLESTGLFDTHPSNGDRIRRARQAEKDGVFQLEVPARLLFSNFEVISKQVTLLHYSEDLGIPLEVALLKPVGPVPASA